MRKALITVAIILAALLAAAGIATIAYTYSEDHRAEIFPEGTSINGVDCSGMNYDEASEALTDEWNSKHIQVVGQLGETLEDFTDFGCSYDLRDSLSSVRHDNFVPSALNHYFHIPFDASIVMKVASRGSDFESRVRASDFLNREGVTETRDAYVDLNRPDFPIIQEVYGTKADPDAFMDDLIHAIAAGQFRFVYDENAYRSAPKVKQDDPGLIRYRKFCLEYLNQKITYKLGSESFTITAEELSGLMKDDLSGKADEDAVSKFVTELKKKYDISGGEVHFHSLTGRTFKVNRGDYIWVIDPDGESVQLTSDINSHKDVDREPVYLQKGAGTYSKELNIGDTYVDIDLSRQHVSFFKEGKQKYESDCVTGCIAAGHGTPTGIYSLGNKSRNITLKGGGKKGSKTYYESFVNYWMAFIGNSIGLHDASWRSSFGGEIYKYSGSHGCVNLPPSKAGDLYKVIDIGTPVIVHY